MSATGQQATALTSRQEEICGLLRQGMSNKMIAGALGISEGTVKNHISEILRVLNATNRTQAAQLDRTTMLDVDEYLHLALHASSLGEHHACMTYLKEALRQQPRHATAIYLLAVQHAELGLFERAIGGMRTALSIEPRLEIARFQLGLLLLDRNLRAEAREHFALLGDSADTALRIYAEAMIEVADDNMAAAKEKLALGLSQPSANRALSALMQRLLGKLARSNGADVSEVHDGVPDNRVFLGAYGQASP